MPVVPFKVGDRVIAKIQHLGHQKAGTIKYASGTQYWVLFDGDEKVTPSVAAWFVEPLKETRRPRARRRAA